MKKVRIDISEKTADQIAAARRFRSYTQKILAEKLNVEQGEVSRLESGKRNMQLQTLQSIADALDMEVKIELVPKEAVEKVGVTNDTQDRESGHGTI